MVLGAILVRQTSSDPKKSKYRVSFHLAPVRDSSSLPTATAASQLEDSLCEKTIKELDPSFDVPTPQELLHLVQPKTDALLEQKRSAALTNNTAATVARAMHKPSSAASPSSPSVIFVNEPATTRSASGAEIEALKKRVRELTATNKQQAEDLASLHTELKGVRKMLASHKVEEKKLEDMQAAQSAQLRALQQQAAQWHTPVAQPQPQVILASTRSPPRSRRSRSRERRARSRSLSRERSRRRSSRSRSRSRHRSRSRGRDVSEQHRRHRSPSSSRGRERSDDRSHSFCQSNPFVKREPVRSFEYGVYQAFLCAWH
jgi:hypothetical protein